MDSHISLRGIQVKRVNGVGVRLLPVHQQDVVLQTAPALLPARLPSPNQTQECMMKTIELHPIVIHRNLLSLRAIAVKIIWEGWNANSFIYFFSWGGGWEVFFALNFLES